ncbi:hypothetical protein ACVR05_02180 [Streptococcus caprae]|uniref:Type VII secretion protein EssA n=1 Tax=Streptococcus caprae TaxID=1640501 RepID=A0ABV8CWE9_9STRE
MKKSIGLMLLLGLCLTLPVKADDLGESPLIIDSSRLEQDIDKGDLGTQSELIQGLFSEKDQELLEIQEDKKQAAFEANRQELFKKGNIKAINLETMDLFQGDSVMVNTKVDSAYDYKMTAGTWIQIGYVGLVLLTIAGASYLSYRVYISEG